MKLFVYTIFLLASSSIFAEDIPYGYIESLKKSVQQYEKIYMARRPLLSNSKMKEIGITKTLTYPYDWELNQIGSKWAYYTNRTLLTLPERYQYIVAIRLKSIDTSRRELMRNERLFQRFQFLGFLEKGTAKTHDGFSARVIYFEAFNP